MTWPLGPEERVEASGRDEVAREAVAAGEARGGCPGELGEVAHQVRLVEVPALERHRDPVGAVVDRAPQDLLEPYDAGQALRRQADGIAEAAFELPERQPGCAGQGLAW